MSSHDRTALGAGHALAHRLAVGTAANVAGQVMVAALLVLSTPYITTQLGPRGYGVLVLLLAYVDAFSLLDLGISTALVRQLAASFAKNEHEEAGRYFGAALTMFAIAGLATTLVVTASARWVLPWLAASSGGPHAATFSSLAIASAAFMLRFIAQPLSAVPLAAQRFDLTNLVRVTTEALKISGVVTALWLGYALDGVLLVILAVAGVAVLANLLIARHLLPGLAVRPRFSLRHIRELFHFSKFVLVANVSGRVVHSADKFIIGYLLSASAVAFYAIPYTLSEKLWLLVGNVTSVVYPTASALHAQGHRTQLRELYTRSTKIVAASIALPALLLCLFSHDLLLHWIGPQFAEYGALPLRLLSVAFLVNSLAHIPFVISQSLGFPRTSARFAALNALLTLGFLVTLVPYFGIVGAAAGLLTAQLLLTPWFIHTANRFLGIPGRHVFVRSFLPVLAVAAPVGVLSTLLHPLAFSLPSLLALFGLALAVYLTLLFAFALDGVERDLCRRFAGRTVSALKARTTANA